MVCRLSLRIVNRESASVWSRSVAIMRTRGDSDAGTVVARWWDGWPTVGRAVWLLWACAGLRGRRQRDSPSTERFAPTVACFRSGVPSPLCEVSDSADSHTAHTLHTTRTDETRRQADTVTLRASLYVRQTVTADEMRRGGANDGRNVGFLHMRTP